MVNKEGTDGRENSFFTVNPSDFFLRSSASQYRSLHFCFLPVVHSTLIQPLLMESQHSFDLRELRGSFLGMVKEKN